ncbi:MAG TPA: DUF4382 domain-containing protein [Gammaproteobacteria bacterium]|nr:DUF4382 domain-containing protein [Gammaproteobacteria bacterium]
MLHRTMKTATVALSSLFLASCLTGGGSVHGVNLAITDAPVDMATSVPISFSQIQLSGPNASTFTENIAPASSIDMYQLQGGIAATIVTAMQVQPGHYTNLRLTIASDQNSTESSISLPDGVHVLYIPQGVSPQVNIPVDFTIASGGDVSLTVDFNLRNSIIQDPNDPTRYELIPSMRAVEDKFSGAITGSVPSSLIACLDPAVYVYQGANVKPTDVDVSDPNHVNPISSALVGLNQTTSNYNFTVGFLPAGPYTVAFTCEANQDVANQANTLTFTAVANAVVSNNSTTFISLQ